MDLVIWTGLHSYESNVIFSKRPSSSLPPSSLPIPYCAFFFLIKQNRSWLMVTGAKWWYTGLIYCFSTFVYVQILQGRISKVYPQHRLTIQYRVCVCVCVQRFMLHAVCSNLHIHRHRSWPRDWTRVSHTAGRLFTIWATREAPIYIHIYKYVCVYTHLY